MASAHHPGAGPVRARRRWRVLLLSLTSLLGGVLAAALFLLYSESALRWGVALLTQVLVEPLEVAEAHGRLAGPFTLRGITYADGQNRLSLDALEVNWKPANLLAATVHVSRLHAKGLGFTQQTGEAEPAPPEGKITLPQIGFPLKFILEDATLDDIVLQLPDRDEPLALTQLALQAETRLNTLQLNALRLRSDWLSLDLSGSIRPRQDYRADLSLAWSVPQQDKRPWQGQGTLRGNLRELELQQRLASPFAAELSVTARDLLAALAWQGRLAVTQLDSSQLPSPVAPAFTIGGVLRAQGDLDSFTASSTFSGQVEKVGAVEGSLDAAYAGKRLQINRLQLARQNDAARIEADGDIELATPLRYRMQARWQTLSWPPAVPVVVSNSGRVGIEGEDSRYRFDGELELGGAQIPEGNWRLQGSGDTEAVAVNRLAGELLDGTVTGTATITLAPQLRWQAQLSGAGLNPAAKWPHWPGRLAFAADTSGELVEQGPELALSLHSLSGTLRGRQVKGSSQAALQGGIATLTALELQLGSARFSAQGRMSDELAVNWQLDAEELGDLLPQASGSLKGDGRISGPPASPALALRLAGNTLAFTDYRVGRLHADVALDLRENAPSQLELRLEQLQLPGFPQQTVTLTGEGPIAAHRLTLDSRSAQQGLNLVAQAGYTDEHWAGTIDQLRIDDKNLGRWQLARAAPFSLMAGAMSLDETCLVREDARLCTRGQWAQASGLDASLSSTRFPLQLLRPYLPRRFGIEGELDGSAMLSLQQELPPRVKTNLTLGAGRFYLLSPEAGDETLSLKYASARIQLNTSAEGNVEGELVLSLDQQDSISLDLQTSLALGMPVDLMQHPLEARLRASLRDMAFISSMIPEVQDLRGHFDADVRLVGTPAKPRLSGQARLDEAQLAVPRMGVKLSGLHLSATGEDSRQMNISGGARSGDGELTLNGQLAPTETGPTEAWTFQLTMTGKDFEVARIPEARVAVSPNLTVHIVGREIRLEGELDIPSARLEPPDIRLAVKSSDDVIFVGEDEEEMSRELWLITTRVRITAADSIRFIGYGFDGRIGGNLLLIDEPHSVSRARGELHVVPGSTYEAFKQKLSTERGRLNFADSPLDNPNLDIRAARTVGDVVAGVNVRGTAKKPILTLYSEPPMDQADILSYITLGHAMNTTGQSDGEALAGAAGTAGLVGGNYLAGYIGRQFGLEDARVEADPSSQSPWVVVGKYLSPRLYVRYGVGVYEDAYSVIVRYQLTEHWQVQGEGGRSSGADIFYTLERP